MLSTFSLFRSIVEPQVGHVGAEKNSTILKYLNETRPMKTNTNHMFRYLPAVPVLVFPFKCKVLLNVIE